MALISNRAEIRTVINCNRVSCPCPEQGRNPNSQLSSAIFGDGTEVFIDLQKNDDSYGIPHGTLNKKQTSNQEDSPHLPEFSNKTNLSIRIDVSQ